MPSLNTSQDIGTFLASANKEEAREVLGVTAGDNHVPQTVANRTARLAFADGIPGVTQIIQSDLIGIIWTLIASDATQDSSWIGQPYTTQSDGTLVLDLTVSDSSGTIPPVGALGRVGNNLTIGDGSTSGGRALAFSSDLTALSNSINTFPLTVLGTSTNAAEVYALSSIPTNWKLNQTTLKALFIGSDVTSIGTDAFRGCSGMIGNLKIPNNVTSLGTGAFRDCSGFTGTLTLPNTITSIGNDTFRGCWGLSGALTIPNSVTSIGSSAFSGCYNFTGVLTIPNSVTSIGSIAFNGCYNFTGALTIPNSVTSIGSYAFAYMDGITSLTIPNSVTFIGGLAFAYCYNLSGTLTIPPGITFINGSVFEGCSGFTGTLVIPDNITRLNGGCFFDCSGFNRIEIRRMTAPTMGVNDENFTGMTGVSPAVIHVPVGATGYAASYDGFTVVYDLVL